MKKRLLIVALCLACVASFAQTKKKPVATKKAPVKKVVKAAPKKLPAAADTTAIVKKQPPVKAQDTIHLAAGPAKPFDRPVDGYYKKADLASNHVTPYANLREADVVFSKRMWREIDIREKLNEYMGNPDHRLISILMDALAAEELTAYDPMPTANDPGGDAFSRPLTARQAMNRMADSVSIDKFDPKTGDKIGSYMKAGEFNPDSVIKFRIKEDWVFDKQRSVVEPRIIGIAPLVKIKVSGVNLDYQPAFWIYFPAARQVLATKEAFNSRNDAAGLSYDDMFMKRKFASYVVKESNSKDERIKDYADGLDRLYESERVQKTLMDWELNLWQY